MTSDAQSWEGPTKWTEAPAKILKGIGNVFSPCRTQPKDDRGFTAVPQLLYPEPTAINWHFSQENATFLDAGKGM